MRLSIFVVIVLVLSALVGWVWFSYENATSKPVIFNKVTIEIEKGDSFSKIVNKLVGQSLPVNPLWVKLIAYRQGVVNKLKVGEYELTPNLTIPQILTIFAEGRSKKYTITFPEGWSFKEILFEIEKQPNIKVTLQKQSLDQIPLQLGMNEKHPEGWIFPDTYYFEKNATDISILKRAYSKMQAVLQEEWQAKEPGLPYKTPYEALIMASIIEKETGVEQERPMIAGVFTRRLQKGMLLQTDPTVIYGMGDDFKGNIRVSDLKSSTPYNTYIIQGLPPTPIAMPGREAIHAALHPDKENNLYFVAKGDGSHQFSPTVSEHNRAVNLYQKHKK